MSDLVLVSTTDSPEQVQAALTGTPAAEPAPASSDESGADAATSAEGAGEDGEAAATESPEQAEAREAAEQARTNRREKRKQSIQEEINELIARRGQARRDVEAEEARIYELRRQRTSLETPGEPASAPAPADEAEAETPAAPPQAATFEKPKPKLGDKDPKTGKPLYADYDKWIEALSDWTAEKAEFAAEQKIAAREWAERARIERDSADRARTETLATYQEKLAEFRKSAPDFDAAYEDAAEDVAEIQRELGVHAIDTIDLFTTRDADNGPAVIYHLLTHPDEMKAIAGLPVARQLIVLSKLDERLATKAAHGPSRRVPAVTRAPEPIKPLGQSPTPAVASDPENEDYQSYRARRNAEEAAARGRR